MNKFIVLILFALGMLASGCNRDVFVDGPKPVTPEPEPTPTPGPEPDPVITDSLVLTALEYFDDSLELIPGEEWVQDATSVFENHTHQSGVSIMMDNYNKAIVNISNSTYFVTPWAKIQPDIPVPGINAEGEPGFFGDIIPFKIGYSSFHTSLRAGEVEHFPLPEYSKVTVVVYTTFRVVKAKAQITYYNTDYPTITETGWVDVKVSYPVDIKAVWGDVISIKE